MKSVPVSRGAWSHLRARSPLSLRFDPIVHLPGNVPADLVALVTPSVRGEDKALLKQEGWLVQPVDAVENPNLQYSARLKHVYSKLAIFNLTQYSSIVFLVRSALAQPGPAKPALRPAPPCILVYDYNDYRTQTPWSSTTSTSSSCARRSSVGS